MTCTKCLVLQCPHPGEREREGGREGGGGREEEEEKEREDVEDWLTM